MNLELTEQDQIVIKTGTNVVMREREGVPGSIIPDYNTMENIAWDIGNVMSEINSCVKLVSSGAIGFARDMLSRPKPETVPGKQAYAAMGQNRLQAAWDRAFESQQTPILTSMHLLTRSDFHGEALENLLNTFDYLDEDLPRESGHFIVPIINENDSISTEEITFGDNDQLAANVAVATRAKILILLSDVDGVYEKDPRTLESAKKIPVIDTIITNEFINEVAPKSNAASAREGTSNGEHDVIGGDSRNGAGGMRSKLMAAQCAQRNGVIVVIAKGKRDGVVQRIVQGDMSEGTWVMPCDV